MIDTHCHINDELYSSDPLTYVEEAKNAGVRTLFVIGFDIESSKKAIEIANKFENCYAAVGVHPSDWKKAPNNAISELEAMLKDKKVIAIGEIGLDFYWDKDEDIKNEQVKGFIKQIELANKYNLPVIIHCREANEMCLKVIREHKLLNGGIMHCYAASHEMAHDFIREGLLLGIGGVVTFKNGVKTKEVVEKISLESLVLETDAPYLTPEPFRGKPNHSKYLEYVCKKIADIKGVSFEEVESVTTSNAIKMFKL